jgi:hypothetical protein
MHPGKIPVFHGKIAVFPLLVLTMFLEITAEGGLGYKFKGKFPGNLRPKRIEAIGRV